MSLTVRFPSTDDEQAGHDLQRGQKHIIPNPHQPGSTAVHQEVPEITIGMFVRETIATDQKTGHNAKLQPLSKLGQRTDMPDTDTQTNNDTRVSHPNEKLISLAIFSVSSV